MKIDNRDVYEQIGNLFYAIAADQKIKPLEVGELKFFISSYWLPSNHSGNNLLVSDEAHIILSTMDALERGKASPADAFTEFSGFLTNHPEVFTKELKQRIFDTTRQIVRIFHADNPEENVHLKMLENVVGLTKVGTV